jgi:hypothetical protein
MGITRPIEHATCQNLSLPSKLALRPRDKDSRMERHPTFARRLKNNVQLLANPKRPEMEVIKEFHSRYRGKSVKIFQTRQGGAAISVEFQSFPCR